MWLWVLTWTVCLRAHTALDYIVGWALLFYLFLYFLFIYFIFFASKVLSSKGLNIGKNWKYFTYFFLILYLRSSFSWTRRPIATKFGMMIRSCCSFDPLHQICHFTIILTAKTAVFSDPVSHCAPAVLSIDKFYANKRLSINLRCFLHQMTPILFWTTFIRNNWAVRLVGRSLLRVTVSHAVHTVQTGPIWGNKPHRGLFSGKAFSVATPSSSFMLFLLTVT